MREDIVEYPNITAMTWWRKDTREELESVKLVPTDDAQNEAGTRFHQDL